MAAIGVAEKQLSARTLSLGTSSLTTPRYGCATVSAQGVLRTFNSARVCARRSPHGHDGMWGVISGRGGRAWFGCMGLPEQSCGRFGRRRGHARAGHKGDGFLSCSGGVVPPCAPVNPRGQ